jgi:hypothetical protein
MSENTPPRPAFIRPFSVFRSVEALLRVSAGLLRNAESLAKKARLDSWFCFANVRGIGYRRHNDVSLVGEASWYRQRLRRMARRSGQRLTKVQNFDMLTDQEKLQHQSPRAFRRRLGDGLEVGCHRNRARGDHVERKAASGQDPGGLQMIARSLAVAIAEAIQAHAEQHHRGKMDMNRTLSALGDVTSGFLAELTTLADRASHYGALVGGIAQQTVRKLAEDPQSTTAH